MLVLLLLFVGVFVTHLVFVSRKNRLGEMVTKPVLIPLLLLFYVLFNPHPQGLVVAALAFGFAGDALLLGRREIFFILGLAAFLLGNLFYLAAFLGTSGVITGVTAGNTSVVVGLLWGLIPYALGGFLVIRGLWRPLGPMRVPALVYLIVIFLMSWSSWFMLSKGLSWPAVAGIAGSLLFIISDVVLTVNLFVRPEKRYQLVVMLLYVTAQALLMGSFLFAS